MTEEIINSDGSRNWEANILLDNVKRLEQENKELKDELKPYKHPDVVTLLTNWRTGELDRIHNKIANERDTYRSVLEEIIDMFSNQVAWVGQLTNFEEEIYNKINEVLQ